MIDAVRTILRSVIDWLLRRPVIASTSFDAAAPAIIPLPQRFVRMDATALNDRRGSGMRCRGFLGRPTVVMLG